MEFIRPDTNFNFVGNRHKAFLLSAFLILAGLLALLYRGGLNLGVDFAGGTLIHVKFSRATSPEQIRESLKGLISQGAIQQIGSAADHEYLIRTETTTEELQSIADNVEATLGEAYGEGVASVLRIEMVGPKVGHDLRQKALFAIYYALLFIAIYISGRFEFKWAKSGIMAGVLILGVYLLEALGMNVTYLTYGALIITMALCWFLHLPYALGAIVALVHDVLITIGFFALTNREFSLEVLAAILTLVGFSLNDTIVVYDRIRENVRRSPKGNFLQIINSSINQSLSRTILTSGTVLLVAACLFFLGGTVIHDFSFALLIGIITGTYSSIFVAAPLLIFFQEFKKKPVVRAKA